MNAPHNIDDLPRVWRGRAAYIRQHTADEGAAKALDVAADELEAFVALRASEPLSLREAAVECGYSASTLSRMVRDGKLPNVGTEARIKVRRGDLPRRGKRREIALVTSGERSIGPLARTVARTARRSR